MYKNIYIYEFYTGNKKTERTKAVSFRYPNGYPKKDRKRSHRSHQINNKSEKIDTKYSILDVQMIDVRTLTTINYNNGTAKTIEIHKFYADNTKTPMLNYKIVEFIHPNCSIDKDRSYFNSLIDKSEKFDTKYTSLDVQMLYYNNSCTKTIDIATRETEMLATIHYNDGNTKKIKIYEIYTGDSMTPVLRYKTVRFILPNGTIDNDRSYDCKLIIDKSEELDTEYKNLDIQMLTNIYYKNGTTKIIELHKDRKKNKLSTMFQFPDNSIYHNITYDRYECDP